MLITYIIYTSLTSTCFLRTITAASDIKYYVFWCNYNVKYNVYLSVKMDLPTIRLKELHYIMRKKILYYWFYKWI